MFPGATLAELEDCAFYGILDGASNGNGENVKEDAYAHIVVRYPADESEAAEKLFLQMSRWDNIYTKNVIVELTSGTGGVYGRAVLSYHCGKSNNKVAVQTFGVKDDGSGVTNYTGTAGAKLATGDHTQGYGIKRLGATRLVSGAARLAFPGKTVADIFRVLHDQRTQDDRLRRFRQGGRHDHLQCRQHLLDDWLRRVQSRRGASRRRRDRPGDGGVERRRPCERVELDVQGGRRHAKASGQIITVSEGGTLDINGNTALGYTTIIFNGGTVYGATEQFNCAKSLTADSFLYVTDAFKFQGSALALNGHMLSVHIESGKNLL